MAKRYVARSILTRNAVAALDVIFLFAMCTGLSCDRTADHVDGSHAEPEDATHSPVQRVVFPDELRVDYGPANDFISEALSTCVHGDYEAFRLLWSAKQDPLRREEFEQGWQAVKTVRVRAVEKIVVPTDDKNPVDPHVVEPDGIAPDVSYVLLADAEFDTSHRVGKRRAKREFVLLVLREQGQWRLGRAPDAVRVWIKARVDEGSDDLESPPAVSRP